MNHRHSTLINISSILSLKTNSKDLYNILNDNNFDWDALVKTGSSHLVLLAIYSNLKNKKLLHLLPKDLIYYLDEISTINRNRNLTLLEECKTISKLFNEYKINHVFVKGIALLAGNYYADDCERMIGDIDILVDKNQLTKAYNLLKTHNYTPLNSELNDDYLAHRHLDRLIPKNGLGAVELHHQLLRKNYKNYLNPLEILNSKSVVNNIAIPNNNHLLQHTILANQINDYGYLYNSLNLKSAYDSLLILNNEIEFELDNLLQDKLFRNYFLRYKMFFNEFPKFEATNKERFKLLIFKLKQKSKLLRILHHFYVKQLINFTQLIKNISMALKHRKHLSVLIKKIKRKINS